APLLPDRRLFPVLRPPPGPALFPYTTLFRSAAGGGGCARAPGARPPRVVVAVGAPRGGRRRPRRHPPGHRHVPGRHRPLRRVRRSEEHTSELQSRSDLVCRLLLEKKKNKKKQ